MAASPALRTIVDVESFMVEYYAAWGGTDEDRIMSYYADDVTVQIPGSLMQGNSAVREQFVRPFIAAFPGNRHVVRNVFVERNSAVVEFTFEAIHKGPFAGHAASGAPIDLAGCGVYEYDPVNRQITSARIYFDVGTLLKQIIDQRSPRSRTEEAAAIPSVPGSATDGAPMVEHLDVATVIAVSQAVSGEMVLEKLLDTLMRTAVEHAGAERALLILSRDGEPRIAAEATTSTETVMVHLRDQAVTGFLLPETVLRHVLHARESVILDDAAIVNPFTTDPYIARRHARSVFCLPLMNQAKLIGALYLENNLAPRVFAPASTGAEAARLPGRDLAGEFAALSRSRGSRREDPAPGRRQRPGDLHLESRRRHRRGQRSVSAHAAIRPRGCRFGSFALDRADAGRVARRR